MTALEQVPGVGPQPGYYVELDIDGIEVPVVTPATLAAFASSMKQYAGRASIARRKAAQTWSSVELVVRRYERLYEKQTISHEDRLGWLAVLGSDTRLQYIPTATYPDLFDIIEFKLKVAETRILSQLGVHLEAAGVVMDADILPGSSVRDRPVVRDHRRQLATAYQLPSGLVDLDNLDDLVDSGGLVHPEWQPAIAPAE